MAAYLRDHQDKVIASWCELVAAGLRGRSSTVEIRAELEDLYALVLRVMAGADEHAAGELRAALAELSRSRARNGFTPRETALGVFCLFTYEGVKHHGPIGYLKSLMPGGVKGPIVLLIFPIEILSNFLRLISLTVRLWANLLAGHMLIAFMGGELGVLVGLMHLLGIAAPLWQAAALFAAGWSLLTGMSWLKLMERIGGGIEAVIARVRKRREERREGRAGGLAVTHYQLRQRMISIGDDYVIENDRGERVFKVDGKALRVRKTLLFEDMQGRELCKIQERMLRVKDSMEIEDPDGRRIAMVQKAMITPVRERWVVKVDGPDLHVQGNIVDHEYTIERDGDRVAEISKRWFRVRDTYGVEVAPGENDVLILATTAVIDEMAHPDR